MDIGIVRGLITALILLLFLGIWAWSFSKRRKPDFDAAARLPLDDGDKPPVSTTTEELRS